jgi:hypothetical protein
VKCCASACLQVPALPAGAYTIQLITAGGEASVDPQRAGRFLLLPTITSATTAAANGSALPLAAGSLAGGSLLTLTSDAGDWGAGFNSTHPGSNAVVVSGQPCPVVSASAGLLTCRVPRASGAVRAEYWTLPRGAAALPDLADYTSPGGWAGGALAGRSAAPAAPAAPAALGPGLVAGFLPGAPQ